MTTVSPPEFGAVSGLDFQPEHGVILGSSAPAHLWLVPMAVLGIHVSDDFRAGLEDTMGFEERGEITLKGVGPTRTHWLVSRQRQGS